MFIISLEALLGDKYRIDERTNSEGTSIYYLLLVSEEVCIDYWLSYPDPNDVAGAITLFELKGYTGCG